MSDEKTKNNYLIFPVLCRVSEPYASGVFDRYRLTEGQLDSENRKVLLCADDSGLTADILCPGAFDETVIPGADSRKTSTDASSIIVFFIDCILYFTNVMPAIISNIAGMITG